MKKINMTLEALEQALKVPESWKRWDALSAFKQTEFGVEALLLLRKLLADNGFGVLTVPEFPEVSMPFVPTGSDGNGAVFALMSAGKRVGIELSFA